MDGFLLARRGDGSCGGLAGCLPGIWCLRKAISSLTAPKVLYISFLTVAGALGGSDGGQEVKWKQ